MPAGKRILIYFLGFFIGCVLVYFALFQGRNRTYWLPANRVKNRIQNSKILFSAHAKYMMACNHISETDINGLLQDGDVNFRESNVHAIPCPSYILEGKNLTGDIKLTCTVCDSITYVTAAMNVK
jgi:hypothetical protein